MDIQEQLRWLRQTVARIDSKYAAGPVPEKPPSRGYVEDLLSGEVVETPLGKHFETEKLTRGTGGTAAMTSRISSNCGPICCRALSDGAIVDAHPTRWAFLDTETTGLAGGRGRMRF